MILLGILLRLALMPISAHSDLFAHLLGAYLFSDGVSNIYDFLYSLPKAHPIFTAYSIDFYGYPPLAYWLLGLFQLPFDFLRDQSYFGWLLGWAGGYLNNPFTSLFLFLAKVPYLFFDLATAFLLFKFFESSQKGRFALVYWLFCPLALYTSFLFGHFDILAIFFVVLALYLVKQKQPSWASLALGIGGAIKLFPLIFLLPLVLVSFKKTGQRLLGLLLGLLPLLLTSLPFWNSPHFWRIIFLQNQSQRFLGANFPLAEGSIFLFLVVYFLVNLYLLNKGEQESLWQYLLIILLAFFSFSYFHPQWLLWLAPFLVIDLTQNPKHFSLHLVFYLYFLGLLFLFEPSINIGLFAPAAHSLNFRETIRPILLNFGVLEQIKGIFRSFLVAWSIWFSYRTLREQTQV